MPLLRRALTKLKEGRDFHKEKAINSSIAQGTERGRQGGRTDVWRYKQHGEAWGKKRAKKTAPILVFLIQGSGAEQRYDKPATFDVFLPNVQNPKKASLGAYSQKYIREKGKSSQRQTDRWKRGEVGNGYGKIEIISKKKGEETHTG